jgi:hypothetical protein
MFFNEVVYLLFAGFHLVENDGVMYAFTVNVFKQHLKRLFEIMEYQRGPQNLFP